jgi:hypothetical protein
MRSIPAITPMLVAIEAHAHDCFAATIVAYSFGKNMSSTTVTVVICLWLAAPFLVAVPTGLWVTETTFVFLSLASLALNDVSLCLLSSVYFTPRVRECIPQSINYNTVCPTGMELIEHLHYLPCLGLLALWYLNTT